MRRGGTVSSGPGRYGMAGTFSDPQAEMLDRVAAKLQNDERFEALLGSGSLAYGGFDENSDLDLVVVTRSDSHVAVMTERRGFASDLGELLAAFTGEHVGEP